MWVMKWAELLQIRSEQTSPRASVTNPPSSTSTGWSRRSPENVPMDQIVRNLLGASGGTFNNPPHELLQRGA